jgi:ribosomal protein S18 acetylase RimI-like enzyme
VSLRHRLLSDANRGARRLYEKCGYRVVAERAMVKSLPEN